MRPPSVCTKRSALTGIRKLFAMHRVFIYGTLKRGFPNHQAGLAAARFLGRVRTHVAFPLVIGGRWFSPYLLDEAGRGQRVFGELFQVDDTGLARLDEMEGVGHPRGYRRILVGLVEPDEKPGGEAFTYVKARSAIEAIHSGPLDEYHFDARYVVPDKRDSVF